MLGWIVIVVSEMGFLNSISDGFEIVLTDYVEMSWDFWTVIINIYVSEPYQLKYDQIDGMELLVGSWFGCMLNFHANRCLNYVS